MKKIVSMLLMMVLAISVLTGCSDTDKARQLEVAANLAEAQQTPTDIDYSLERYNLIRRAYWVNGQREKALALPCSIEKPLGYVILITDNGAILGNFVVDGKVSSLNSFLTPDTTYPNSAGADWLADVDGSYGENDAGIFFFTPDGKYIEWTGTYLYSDIPFEVEQPVLKISD